MNQYLSSGKILKVFIICNNVDKKDWTLEIMMPNFESFKNG